MQLQAGMEAPSVTLLDAAGQGFSLSAQRGKRVVLYFYPKDDTPGCTIEANEFTVHAAEFAALNTLVVGLSRDDCASHAAFRDKYGLAVILLADTESVVCAQYGVLYDKEVEGVKKVSIQRSTFVVDAQGKLSHALYGIQARGHAEEILNLIKEMK
jgi:thioredoxin-dependent peroxiredoxin